MDENYQALQRAGNDAKIQKKELRIELVRRLMLRGVKSPIEIQKSLATMDPPVILTLRSVYRYKGVLIRRNVKDVREKVGLNKTIEELAMELKSQFEEVSRELWKQYHSSYSKASTKVQALKEIRETTQKYLEIMQSLGLISKAPEKHQMVDKDGNPIDPVPAERVMLNQQFIAFIKAQYQEPLGTERGNETPEEQQ